MAICVGIALRAVPILSSDFPITDGGLFLVMIEAVRASRYALPAAVSYNGVDLPFAYPPLGFYLAALTADLTGISALDLLRYIPLAASVGALLAFTWAASRVLASWVAVAVAVALFAVAPGGYVSLLMGGGLTRGLGYLLMIVALERAYTMYMRQERRAVALCALFSGLTLLSHPSMAWFLAVSILALFLASGRSRAGVISSVAVGGGVLVVVAPWAVVALGQLGPTAFLAAFQKGSFIVSSTVGGEQSLEGMVGLGLALIALAICLVMAATGHRGLFLLGWMGLMILLVPRELTRVSTVPLALAAGEIVAALASGISRPSPPTLRGWIPWSIGAAVALALWPVISSVLTDRDGFVALSAEERAPMRWAREATPDGSRFLIITARSWPRDRVSEWFPVLTERVSVVTPQGTEWTSDGRFGRLGEAHALAQQCASKNAACLAAWAADTGIPFDYVYVAADEARGCCPSLVASLQAAPGYRHAYASSAATIFQRTPQTAGAPRGSGDAAALAAAGLRSFTIAQTSR